MSPQSAFTYRDYEALPNDGRRYEIHEGELCVTPAPSPQRQLISGALFVMLSRWRDGHPGGRFIYSPLDVILAETTIVQPDIIYLGPDRLERISRRGIEGAPTLAIEILSPSTRATDRASAWCPTRSGPKPRGARAAARRPTSSRCRSSRRPR